jgi:hypothetical protein
MQKAKYSRRRKLIKPDLQPSLVGAFGGVAVLAMLLQFLMLGYFMIRAASRLDGGGGELAGQVPSALLSVLGLSLLILVPLFLALGVLLTFRVAGPVYRFEQFLAAVARGEQTAPCRLRDKDKLVSLCDAINVATEPLRRQALERKQAEDEQAEGEQAEGEQAAA